MHNQTEKVLPSVLVSDVVTYLQAHGFGSVGATLFHQAIPSSPAVCLGVFPAGGPEDFREVISRPRFQIMVRGLDPRSVNATANRVFQHFHKNFVDFATCRGRVTADHYPTPAALDSNNKILSYLNFSFLGVVKVV